MIDYEMEALSASKGGQQLVHRGVAYRPLSPRDRTWALPGDVRTAAQLQRSQFSAKQKAGNQSVPQESVQDTFLSNMSHEMRTPLTGIMGFAELLSDTLSGDEREFAELIRQNGNRLMETITCLLNYAQLKSNSFEVTPSRFDAVLEARRSLKPFQCAMVRKGLELKLEVSLSSIMIHTDQVAFRRILFHLLSNAEKFTSKGKVTVGLNDVGDAVELTVADTGIGIDPAFLPHIFDEFRQESQGLARHYEGNGLGLAVTERLVEILGAEISVESKPGRGSTFTVRFPHLGMKAADAA